MDAKADYVRMVYDYLNNYTAVRITFKDGNITVKDIASSDTVGIEYTDERGLCLYLRPLVGAVNENMAVMAIASAIGLCYGMSVSSRRPSLRDLLDVLNTVVAMYNDGKPSLKELQHYSKSTYISVGFDEIGVIEKTVFDVCDEALMYVVSALRRGHPLYVSFTDHDFSMLESRLAKWGVNAIVELREGYGCLMFRRAKFSLMYSKIIDDGWRVLRDLFSLRFLDVRDAGEGIIDERLLSIALAMAGMMKALYPDRDVSEISVYRSSYGEVEISVFM